MYRQLALIFLNIFPMICNFTQFIYFWKTALHVSGGIFTHHQSTYVYNCIYSVWYFLTVRDKNKLLVICI